MARPIKQGLDYFPFDVDFFADEKLNAISWEFGIKGEITTIKLLCAVYRNGYFIEWNDMLRFKLLKELPGVSPDLLDQIVLRLVKWDFFEKSLFDTANILTSKGIQRRYISICTKMRRKNTITQYNLLDPDKKDSENSLVQSETISNKYIVSFTDEVERMKKDEVWIEQGICMKLHIDKNEVITLLNQFHAHCISFCSEKPHKSYGDAQQHFIRWYRTEEFAANKQQTKLTVPHPSARGTKVTQSPTDYTFSGGFGGEDV